MNTLDLTAQIVSAHVANNGLGPGTLPDLISSVYRALTDAASPPVPKTTREPAVPVRKSVSPDRIMCVECGAGFRVMKRHLAREHGLDPAAYRERFGLTADYPMVAPDYAKTRSQIARNIGLGQSRRRRA